MVMEAMIASENEKTMNSLINSINIRGALLFEQSIISDLYGLCNDCKRQAINCNTKPHITIFLTLIRAVKLFLPSCTVCV